MRSVIIKHMPNVPRVSQFSLQACWVLRVEHISNVEIAASNCHGTG